MGKQVQRILALGTGSALDRAAACLTNEGFAVMQVSEPEQARSMLQNGAVDLVVCDGKSKPMLGLLPEPGHGLPWVVLQHDGSPPPGLSGPVMFMEVPVSSGALCGEIKELIAASRFPKPAKKKRLKTEHAKG